MTRPGPRSTRNASLCLVAALSALLMALVGAASAFAEAPPAPHWRLESRPAPKNLPLKGEAAIVDSVANIGDAEANGGAGGETITITDQLPAGLEVTGVVGTSHNTPISTVNAQAALTCSKPPITTIVCTFVGKLSEYEELEVIIRVKTNYTEASEPVNELTVTGGGAPPAEPLKKALKVNGQPTSFGVEAYELTPENDEFQPDQEAGSHPFQLTTVFDLNQTLGFDPLHPNEAFPKAPALERNLNFKLPPGLIGNANVVGNPNAVQQCADADFGAEEEKAIDLCPSNTAVGVAAVTFNDPVTLLYQTQTVPVFNLVPAPGEPARFGFEVAHVPIVLDTSVRTGEDYGATVSVHNASQAVEVLGSRVTFWGTPEDPRHNNARGWNCLGKGGWVAGFNPARPCNKNVKTPGKPAPFLVLPTSCGPINTTTEGTAWSGAEFTGSGEVKGPNGTTEIPNENPTGLKGCESLDFNPSVEVIPDKQSGSTPTGMTVKVSLPQSSTLEAEGKAEADIKSTTLQLPEGLQSSAGAADGLQACSVLESGFAGLDSDQGSALGQELEAQHFTPSAASCPDAAKLGTVNIKTPVLEKEVVGSVYLATQDTNPFASPLALYIIAEEAKSKVLVKLAGEVQIDPSTGRLTSVFKNTPQTPFESLSLHLFNNERAAQVTPAHCGSYPSTATFTTWSSNATTERSSEFQVTSGPNGTPCPGPQLPFAPSFAGGSVNSQAGGFTPFTVTIGRPDGNQALETINMVLPPGVAALISEVTPCTEEQAEANACPPASEVGHTTSESGLGGAPVTLGGKVYFTGPLKQTATHGASPFGLLAVTHAAAGPFDLGFVKVLSTININETTAQAIVHSEQIPKMLKGVPVQLKAINVTVERPAGAPFQFNPTNCEELKITGSLTGYEEGNVPIAYPFHASNCGSLPFAPKLTATVLGHATKANGTTFKVTVESPGLGQANIHKVDLTLPEALPSRLTTIQKACLEAVFNANPASCEEGSVIGEGIVTTPVFKNQLRGPAYLVSHGGAAFPDVEFVLQGEGVTLVLDGKTDIKKGITYSRFETAPDAPFTKFESIFPAGPHSALTASVAEKEEFNLCKHTLMMPTEMTAQNGAFIGVNTKIGLEGCGGVLPNKVKKLTRAQLLAKALKVCRTKYKAKSKKAKRLTCEKQARKKYGPKPKKKKSSKKKK